MKLSEQMTNQLRIQGLSSPLKIPSSTLSKWRDEVTQLEDEIDALNEPRTGYSTVASYGEEETNA